ncbi:restriction endonuclease subunit S [Pantoea agglomerans]|uniref:restriction endonuclease subunit S n=1 Tax=Enterobacter agglomerans TaxID=549 RepID=UPI002898767A|nr:restriction endonuclease subunit S [Pantoea agglomerans]WNK57682.1 restriction endonuclease subunit S [Pantoea agglomerans]
MTEQQLPEGWQMVKFGDIAKHISKRVEPSETDLEIYVGLEHLDPDSLKIKRHGTPSDVEGQKLLVKKGQIIFGKRRAYQRKVAVADWDCICSAHAMVLEADPKNIIPEFLPFFMLSDDFMSRAISISEGSLSPTIKWKSLENQVFKIPRRHAQEKLLNVLKKIFEVESFIEETEICAQLVNELVSNDLMVTQGSSAGWKFIKARDVCELITKGASPRWQGFEYTNNGALFVTSENVLHKEVDISSPKFIPHEFSEKNLKRSQLKRGDILVNIVGASIGRCALWDGSYEKANVNQAVALLRPTNAVDPRWLLAQFYSSRGQAYFGLNKVDNARPNLSLKSLSEFEFYLPPKEKQIQIMNAIDQLPKKELRQKRMSIREIFNSVVNSAE